jgi:hypothetical protein
MRRRQLWGSQEMKLINGARVDSPSAARNPLRETALRLNHMGTCAVGLCIECMDKLGEE